MIHTSDFHTQSKYCRGHLPEVAGSTASPPPKRCPDDLKRIELPRPEQLPDASLWQALARRRSVRDYSTRPMSGEDLFALLWATQGITRPGRPALRATPSAGATYPLETYVAALRVDGVPPGVYHWDVSAEHLVLIGEPKEIGHQVAEVCMNQAMCADAACVLFWSAVFERTTMRYGDRGLRYVYLDAGHVGQNLQLAATVMGLGSCMIGAMFDDEVNALLGIDGESEATIYAAGVGHHEA